MPPKPKFTREELAAAAYAIIKEEGLDALTARKLGEKMGSSARPIFTVFQSMEEVKMEARALAFREYREYIKDFWENPADFRYLGIRTVEFGIEYPELFRLLYLQKRRNVVGMTDSLPDRGKLARECADRLARCHDITPREAGLILGQHWLTAFSLGTLCATGACTLPREEIAKGLNLSSASLLSLIRSGRLNEIIADLEAQNAERSSLSSAE